jgi:hypothetical protein
MISEIKCICQIIMKTNFVSGGRPGWPLGGIFVRRDIPLASVVDKLDHVVIIPSEKSEIGSIGPAPRIEEYMGN